MTTFLFIPPSGSDRHIRQVDFASIAGLFAEAEEPSRQTRTGHGLLRLAAAVLLVLLAVGDTLLVARTLTNSPATRSVAHLSL